MQNKKVLALIILSVCLVFGAVLAYLFLQSVGPDDSTADLSVPSYERISAASEDFVIGEQLLRERKAEEAIAYFERALQDAANPDEEAQVKYSMALAYSSTRKNSDGYKKCIALVQEIVKNPEYSMSVKALSLEVMERLLSSSISQEAALIITSDPGYAGFYTDNNISTLRKNLLAYAESCYPLAGVEMKLAALHAKDLRAMVDQHTVADQINQEIDEKRDYVIAAITRGNKDLDERMNVIPRLAVYIPEVLLYKAIAVEHLMYGSNQTPFGDPAELYLTAFESGQKNYRPQIPLIEYHYASYLAKTEDLIHHPKIKELLLQYSNPGSEHAYMAGVFKKERSNVLGEKSNLILLSTIDSSFKEYLVTKLGWVESDFTPPAKAK